MDRGVLMRGLLVALLSGCLTPPGYATYKCDVDHACATGFACIDDLCESVSADVVVFGDTMFMMGCTSADELCGSDAMPQHMVRLSAFTLQRNEVTEAEYQTCIDLHGCMKPITSVGFSADPTLPVRGIPWSEADKYCRANRGRLPTEAEWERAARNTGSDEYAWGSAAPTCDRAWFAGCGDRPVSEDAKPNGDTSDGIHHLVGNVREWVSDFYSDAFYSPDPQIGPENMTPAGERAIRGGGYQSTNSALPAWARDRADLNHGYPDVGFRCAGSL